MCKIGCLPLSNVSGVWEKRYVLPLYHIEIPYLAL